MNLQILTSGKNNFISLHTQTTRDLNRQLVYSSETFINIEFYQNIHRKKSFKTCCHIKGKNHTFLFKI